MKKLIVVMVLMLIVSGATAIEKKVAVKCVADSYVSLLSPDTNYGKEKQVLSQVLFHYDGTTITNKEIKIGYMRYAIPPEIIGKVRVLDARYYFFVVSYKGTSPFPPRQAMYCMGFYPCLTSWDENTVTYNNHPVASGPAFYSLSSTKNVYGHFGWATIDVDSYGISKLQEFVDTGVSYGLALYVDILPPTGSDTLLAGDYIYQMSIASRESGKLSLISVDVEVPTGVLVNGCNVTPSTLGEVKARYR